MLFFLEKSKINKKEKMQKGYPLYQDSSPDRYNNTQEKRVFHAAFFKGSLTLEASLVLPLFIAGIVAMLFFLQVIQVQMHLQKALFNQTMKVAGYTYYVDKAEIIDSIDGFFEAEYIKTAVINEAGKDYIENSYIVNGVSGIKLNLSNVTDEGIIDASLQYKMKVPFDLFNIGEITLVSRARCHTWIGDSQSAATENEEYVYMTEHGSVYHTYKDCTYLVSNIESCLFTQIDSKRNKSGAIYYSCALCCREGYHGSVVYYTNYGTRYHASAVCSNLKSNIYTVTLDSVKGKYELCSKCAKRSS